MLQKLASKKCKSAPKTFSGFVDKNKERPQDSRLDKGTKQKSELLLSQDKAGNNHPRA